MTPRLESLATCFQGLYPAQLYTCSSDGVPNAAYLSHVEYVDAEHVALSFQFFNKSRRNIAENPQALVNVIDPDTGQGWALRLHYERSETAGPLFERMALRIEAIASYCNLKGIFKLRAADVYRVLSIDAIPEETGALRPELSQHTGGLDPVFTVKALQDLSARIHCADTLESLVDSILAGLEESFGFKQSMILVPTEQDGVLVTIATRGYPENGAGSEMRYGEGIGGMVAEARKPIRISGLMRGMLYALAMAKAAQDPDGCRSPDWPTPRASLACRCSCEGSWSPSSSSRVTRPTASTRKTRPPSSCSAATWPSRFRTCSGRSAPPTPTRSLRYLPQSRVMSPRRRRARDRIPAPRSRSCTTRRMNAFSSTATT
jgi:adenylate cyclase